MCVCVARVFVCVCQRQTPRCRAYQGLETVLLGLCGALDLRLELPLSPHNLLLHDLNLLLPLNDLNAELLVADLLLCLCLLQLCGKIGIGTLGRHLHVVLGLLQFVVALCGEDEV